MVWEHSDPELGGEKRPGGQNEVSDFLDTIRKKSIL